MGINASVFLFFGVILKPDAIRPYNPDTDTQAGPAWLSWAGESEDGIEVVETGHYDVPRFAIALCKTGRRAPDWTGMRLGRQREMGMAEVEEVAAFLSKYNLISEVDIGPPQWLVAPIYR